MKSYYIEMPLFFPFQSSFKKFFFFKSLLTVKYKAFWTARRGKKPGEFSSTKEIEMLVQDARCLQYVAILVQEFKIGLA